MRKLIWCGVALCTFGVAGAYYAACYAAKHPDCFLARCANVVNYVGARCSPLLALVPAEKRQPKCAAACDEAQVVAAFEGRCEPTTDPVEPIIVEPIDPGLVPEKPETRVPESLEPTDPGIPFMPYAEVRGEASATQALVNACWNWLATRLTPCEQEVCPANCFVRMSLQPFQEFVRVLHEETATEIQQQVQDAAVPERLPLLPESPLFPQLQVDPHQHHHYPSCPYTGRCPAPLPRGRMVPSLETPREAPTSVPPRNEVDSETSSNSQAAKKVLVLATYWSLR